MSCCGGRREFPDVDTVLRLKGRLEIYVLDKHGRVKDKRIIDNLIVNVGKAQVAGLIGGLVTSPFTYVAIGDGSATYPGQCVSPSATDTALGHEIFRKTADSITQETTTVTNDTVVWDTIFSSADGLTGTNYICEAGLFDNYSGGNMLARQTFTTATVDWDAGDQLRIVWKIQVS